MIQVLLRYAVQDIFEDYSSNCQLRHNPFFHNRSNKNCSDERTICAQAFLDTLLAVQKVDEAMMVVSRKNFIGKWFWGRQKCKFLTFLFCNYSWSERLVPLKTLLFCQKHVSNSFSKASIALSPYALSSTTAILLLLLFAVILV